MTPVTYTRQTFALSSIGIVYPISVHCYTPSLSRHLPRHTEVVFTIQMATRPVLCMPLPDTGDLPEPGQLEQHPRPTLAASCHVSLHCAYCIRLQDSKARAVLRDTRLWQDIDRVLPETTPP